jgi:hypothetical protein
MIKVAPVIRQGSGESKLLHEDVAGFVPSSISSTYSTERLPVAYSSSRRIYVHAVLLSHLIDVDV